MKKIPTQKKAHKRPINPPSITKKQFALAAGATGALVAGGAFFAITKKLQNQVLFPEQAELLPLPPQLAAEVALEFNDQTPHFEMYSIPTPDGYTLEASYLPAAQPSQKYIILVHGITQNLRASLKFYPLFHRLGFNVITYSQRNHGANEPTFTTFGVQEKIDLATVVNHTYNRFGAESKIGLHGVSMGAATVLQYLGLAAANVAFAISDCAYSDALAEFQYRLKVEYPALRWLPFVQANRWLTKLTHRVDLAQASPIATIEAVTTPILFIHGLADTYILPEMAQQLYAAKTNGLRSLWLVPDAKHDNCLETDTNGYEHHVAYFLAQL